MEVAASARKHGVRDQDMLHAVRYHWRSFATRDPAVTMFVGPSTTAVPLEIAVIQDEQGTAIIHAMRARREFLRGWKAP